MVLNGTHDKKDKKTGRGDKKDYDKSNNILIKRDGYSPILTQGHHPKAGLKVGKSSSQTSNAIKDIKKRHK